MFNLTDPETPMMSFGSEFTDPNLLFAMEIEQDAIDPVVAIQHPTQSPRNNRTGYIDGRWVGYTSSGAPIHID